MTSLHECKKMVQWWQLTLWICVCNIHTRTKFCKWHECYHMSIVLSFVSHFLCSINTEGHKYLFQEFTLVINLISSPPYFSFLIIGKIQGNTSILQILLLEANVLKNKQRFISILKNCFFLNDTQKHPPLSWVRKEGTHVFLPVSDIW